MISQREVRWQLRRERTALQMEYVSAVLAAQPRRDSSMLGDLLFERLNAAASIDDTAEKAKLRQMVDLKRKWEHHSGLAFGSKELAAAEQAMINAMRPQKI